MKGQNAKGQNAKGQNAAQRGYLSYLAQPIAPGEAALTARRGPQLHGDRERREASLVPLVQEDVGTEPATEPRATGRRSAPEGSPPVRKDDAPVRSHGNGLPSSREMERQEASVVTGVQPGAQQPGRQVVGRSEGQRASRAAARENDSPLPGDRDGADLPPSQTPASVANETPGRRTVQPERSSAAIATAAALEERGTERSPAAVATAAVSGERVTERVATPHSIPLAAVERRGEVEADGESAGAGAAIFAAGAPVQSQQEAAAAEPAGRQTPRSSGPPRTAADAQVPEDAAHARTPVEPERDRGANLHAIGSREANGARVRIGTVEVRTTLAQPAATPVAEAASRQAEPQSAARAEAAAPLARGLAWTYGLVQG